jgi:Uma2 family endonuclease
MDQPIAALKTLSRPRYLETPQRIDFPSEAMVPETQLHLELRTLLYQLLCDYLGLNATVGSDQFVYYAADDPKQCLAPDAFVRVQPPGEDITSWKTWERGAPEVAVEIVSESDAPELPWQEKLFRYGRLGVKEVIRFDCRVAPGKRLRVWDRVDGSLTERVVTNDIAPSLVLNLTWVVGEAESRPVTLRIATDELGTQRVPTRNEARRVEAEARRVEAEARRAAEARILELEAELKRRGG